MVHDWVLWLTFAISKKRFTNSCVFFVTFHTTRLRTALWEIEDTLSIGIFIAWTELKSWKQSRIISIPRGLKYNSKVSFKISLYLFDFLTLSLSLRINLFFQYISICKFYSSRNNMHAALKLYGLPTRAINLHPRSNAIL